LVPTHVCSDIASGFSLILATNGLSLIPDYTKRLMRPLADAPRGRNSPSPIGRSSTCRPRLWWRRSHASGLAPVRALWWSFSQCTRDQIRIDAVAGIKPGTE
jgi:hypothetical protein